jgi:hypothetical protein
MDKQLDVEITEAANGKPLAVVRNFPGLYAELFPAQLRALAEALVQAADDCEKPLSQFRERNIKAYDLTPR